VALARGLAGGRRRERDDVLARLGIAHRAAARPSQLSGGELARAGLAVALANDPPLIRTIPPSGSSSPARQKSSVDFPEPEGPVTATISPRATRRLTPRSARTSSSPTWKKR